MTQHCLLIYLFNLNRKSDSSLRAVECSCCRCRTQTDVHTHAHTVTTKGTVNEASPRKTSCPGSFNFLPLVVKLLGTYNSHLTVSVGQELITVITQTSSLCPWHWAPLGPPVPEHPAPSVPCCCQHFCEGHPFVPTPAPVQPAEPLWLLGLLTCQRYHCLSPRKTRSRGNRGILRY